MKAGLLALAVLLALAAQLRTIATHPELNFFAYADCGSNLAHGVRQQYHAPPVSSRLPLSTVLAAHIEGLLDVIPWRVWTVALGLSLAFLAFALGCLIMSLEWSLASVAVLLSLRWFAANDYPQTFYALLLLVVASIMVWRAQSPSVWGSFLLALAIGATLLYRSTLAFFPLLLASCELASSYRGSIRLYWRHLVCLGLVPYMFLIPWVRMNWIVQGRFIPFEDGRANANIVGGVLGLVNGSEGEHQLFLDDPAVSVPNASVTAWALREVLGHPLRYAGGYLRRLAFVFWLHPVLFLLALAGLWAYRKRREFRHLGLLIAYFIAIHCFMTVDEQYIYPLWPVLAVMAASLGALFLELSPWRQESGPYRLARHFAFCALGLVLCLCLHATLVVNAYAARAIKTPLGSDEALENALARAPDSAWLLAERAERRLNRGEYPGAIEDFRRSLFLRPRFPGRRTLLLAWADSFRGDAGSLIDWEIPDEYRDDLELDFEARILKACAYVRLGRLREAREQLQLAFQTWQTDVRLPDKKDSIEGRAVLTKLRHTLVVDPAPFRRLTSRERLALMDELLRLSPESVEFWIERAQALAETGDRARALMSVARAKILKPNAEQLKRLAEVSALPAAPPTVVRKVPGSRLPADAVPLIEQAQRAARAGRRGLAIKFLSQAEARGLSEDGMRGVAAVYELLNDYEGVLGVWDRLTERSPEKPGPWIEQARAAARLGQRQQALTSLERAEALKPGPDEAHRMALLYQGLGEYPRALVILVRLTAEQPQVARFWGDRGLCRHLNGQSQEAVKDLERALELDAELLSAYATLGAIYVARQDYDEALRVYDRALSVRSRKDLESLRDLIRDSRNEVLKRDEKRKEVRQ